MSYKTKRCYKRQTKRSNTKAFDNKANFSGNKISTITIMIFTVLHHIVNILCCDCAHPNVYRHGRAGDELFTNSTNEQCCSIIAFIDQSLQCLIPRSLRRFHCLIAKYSIFIITSVRIVIVGRDMNCSQNMYLNANICY